MKKTILHVKNLLFIIGSLCAFHANAQWQQIGTDVIGNENFGLGNSVSMSADGTIMAVGVPNADTNGYNNGQVKVFQYDGNDWMAIGNAINGDEQGDKLGYSVALTPDGTRFITGTPFATTPIANNAGKASVFDWNGTNWVAVGGEISGLVNSENFGWAVTISSNGDRVAVSAPLSGPAGSHLGQVRIFELIGDAWVHMGSEINGQGSEDYMGYSIKFSGNGNRIVIGSHQNDIAFTDAGNLRVFEWDGSNWVQLGETIHGIAESDFFGKNVDVSEDGNRVLGSSLSLNGFTGEVRIYDWNGSSWDTVGQSIIGEYAGDGCGSSAAISADGTTLVVGSSESQGGGDLRGSARVFKLVGNSWLQVDATIYGIADYETVGYTTAISATGETVAVASPLSSLHSTFGGVVRVYEGGVLNTESFSSLNEVTAYPVPARENINIALEQEYGEVTVVQYNVLGKEMNRLKAVGKTKIDFPLKGNPGIYFITISTENSSKTIKIVKE